MRVRPWVGRLRRGHRYPLALRVLIREPLLGTDHERVLVVVPQQYRGRVGGRELTRGSSDRSDAVVEVERGECLGDRGMQEEQALVRRHLSG